MKHFVSDIASEIRKVLELNNDSSALIAVDDIDTLSLNEVIESKIVDAVRFVLEKGAVALLGTGEPLTGDIYWEDYNYPGYGAGRIILPDDFLRLLTFSMSDWEGSPKFITEDSPEYKLQWSKFKGLRGNPEAPVVAIVHYPEGLTLELFCCEDGDKSQIRKASYIAMPIVDEDNMIDIPEKLTSAAIYYAAYLVSLAYSSVEVGNELLKQAYTLAGIAVPTTEQTQQA